MGPALIIVLVALGALAVGILVGRYYVPDDRHLRRTARHSRAYMRALNHLIARDHDTVIDELKRVVEENIEDSEPYFALAALFRSRGEHERAIRVHQALALRESASKKLRLRAKYELGLDFRAAGMPRRATRAMEDALTEDPKHEGALRALCGLYEEQGRYAEAAQAWARLAKGAGTHAAREHHLWVAAAQRAIQNGDLDSAKRLLKDARKHGGASGSAGESAHFFAAAAELAAARGNPRGASMRLRQALTKAPELARFFVPGLVAAERQELERKGAAGPDADELEEATNPGAAATDGPKVIAQLGTGAGPAPEAEIVDLDRTAAERAAAVISAVDTEIGGAPHLRLAAAELRALGDPGAALTAYRALATDFPDFLPARVAAARLALAGSEPAIVTEELRALAGHGGALTWAFDGAWRCGHCAARRDQFFWRCMRCRRWGTVRLDVGRDAIRPTPPAPRERRELPRVPIDRTATEAALLGDTASEALPRADARARPVRRRAGARRLAPVRARARRRLARLAVPPQEVAREHVARRLARAFML
jgi:lipopolysaccharide biosynthesis regulator YciM